MFYTVFQIVAKNSMISIITSVPYIVSSSLEELYHISDYSALYFYILS